MGSIGGEGFRRPEGGEGRDAPGRARGSIDMVFVNDPG